MAGSARVSIQCHRAGDAGRQAAGNDASDASSTLTRHGASTSGATCAASSATSSGGPSTITTEPSAPGRCGSCSSTTAPRSRQAPRTRRGSTWWRRNGASSRVTATGSTTVVMARSVP